MILRGDGMGIVTAHMSMSLDGYVAGPNAGAGNPLGDGGVRIQQWMFDLASFREIQGLSGGQTNKDDEELRQRFAPTGAVVMGRRMFDEGEGPWGDNPPYHMPVFVVTHQARGTLVKEGERRSPSSPTASRAPCSRRRWPRARRMSMSRAV